MAITLTTTLSVTLGSTSDSLSVSNLAVSVAGSRMIHNRQEIGTSEEALILGDVAAGGFLIIVNRDATNFVELRSGTSATDFVRLKPGEPALFRLSPDATAPYAIADTAACEVEYILVEA